MTPTNKVLRGLTLLMLCACLPAQPTATELSADVLVVGAGIAGVTAARNLSASGARVLVLEARERSGGRLLSVLTMHGHVDLGAMWIHDGFAGNPLYDLATELNAPLSKEQDYLSTTSFASTGAPANASARDDVVLAWIYDVLQPIQAMRANATAEDVPIAAIYQAFLDKNRFSPDQLEAANLLMQTTFQVLLNANISALSALRYGDAKIIPAVDVFVQNGFDSLVDALKPGLDIRYNSPIVSVAQGEDGVAVTTADGTVYRARHAIVTQSLGVLKAGGLRFEPPLPQWKQQAISDMGMGVFDKVVLVYDSPFWSPTDFISRGMPTWSGLWSMFLNYNNPLGMPVLVALNSAEDALRLEGMTDTAILQELLDVLRSMYGPDVPPPREYFVTRWGQDPWARGSYSYFAVGNRKNITEVLAQPVGRVLFAGEATSDKPGTVLGAYLSGLREGQRAAQLLAADTPTTPAQEAAVTIAG